MPLSKDPIREVAEVLRRHVDHANLEKIINELLEVRGDKSFRELIQRLADEFARP